MDPSVSTSDAKSFYILRQVRHEVGHSFAVPFGPFAFNDCGIF